MRKTLTVLILTSVTLSGCARVTESRLNPLNWFGRSEPVANVNADGSIRPLVPAGALRQIVDTRPLINSVTALSIDRTPDGAIVRASGQTQGQGFHNAELVAVQQSGGTLTLAFRAAAPGTIQTGTQNITAAYVLSSAELATISRIQVQGSANTLSSNR
jgi:hypothetical protein